MTDGAADREREARIRGWLDREEFLAHVRGAVSDSHLGNTRDLKRHKTLLAGHDAAQRAEIERYREALRDSMEIAFGAGCQCGGPPLSTSEASDHAEYCSLRIVDRAHRALNDGEDDG